MNTHSFSVEFARQNDVKAAIILQHFYYWYQNNLNDEKRHIDGHVWSYNSIKSMCEIFVYYTENEIRHSIDSLIEKGFLVSGNYNKMKMDRTKWYALTDKGISVFNPKIHFCQDRNGLCADTNELGCDRNGFLPRHKAIPNITSNINTNITSNNIESAVFSKNEPAQSEIDLLNAKIARLESLIEQKNKVEAEGAKCNNIANNELAVLSASIGTSYTKAQESKDKPVKAAKKRNNGNITIEEDANFASFEVFSEKWDKVLAAKYPKLDASLVYEWFVPAVQAKYNGTYKDHFAALRTWLGRSSDSELAKLSKFKPTEQYNNEGLINGIIERTKGQPTTMDKIEASVNAGWEEFMKSKNKK